MGMGSMLAMFVDLAKWFLINARTASALRQITIYAPRWLASLLWSARFHYQFRASGLAEPGQITNHFIYLACKLCGSQQVSSKMWVARRMVSS